MATNTTSDTSIEREWTESDIPTWLPTDQRGRSELASKLNACGWVFAVTVNPEWELLPTVSNQYLLDYCLPEGNTVTHTLMTKFATLAKSVGDAKGLAEPHGIEVMGKLGTEENNTLVQAALQGRLFADSKRTIPSNLVALVMPTQNPVESV